jgi:Flp pilus assembly protein TadD
MNFLSSYFRLMIRQANWFAREAGQLAWSVLLWPFRAAGAVLWFVGQLLIDWWESRRIKVLLWGTPALLAIMASVATALTVTSVNRIDRAQKYLLAGRVAMRAESWSTAKLYYERAIELGAREPDAMFDLAIASEQTGDEARKRAVLQRLAPDDQAVYAPAHLWKATRILAVGSISEEQLLLAETQLHHVLHLEPDNSMAHAILGDMYSQRGILDRAIHHLSKSDRKSIFYQLKLAKVLKQTGNLPQAELVATNLLALTQPAADAAPRDVEACLSHAEATLLSGDYENTVTILQNATRLVGADPRLRDALTMALIGWSDSLLLRSAENRPRAFQLLAIGLENSPNEMLLFDRIIKLLKTGDVVADDAEVFLKQNIVTGRAVGVSHLILGTHLFDAGDPMTAGLHLEQAFKQLPFGPVVANNFAWYLIKGEGADAPRALSIIDSVIKVQPENPEFRDTKGHILMKLGRWQDAVAEFETTLETLSNRPTTHDALANAYQLLGVEGLADDHRRAAEHLRKSNK